MKSLKESLSNWKAELAFVQLALGLLILLYPYPVILERVRNLQLALDFNPYFFAGTLFWKAPQALYNLADFPAFFDLVHLAGAPPVQSNTFFGFIYPPSGLMMLSPLALFSYWNGLYVWIATLLLALAGSYIMMLKLAAKVGVKQEAALFASLMCFNIGTYLCLQITQVGLVLCFGLLVFLVCAIERKFVMAALALALISHIKPQHFLAITLCAFIAFPMRFRASLIAIHLGIIAVTTMVLGPDIWLKYASFIAHITPTSFGGSPEIARMPTLQGALASIMGAKSPIEQTSLWLVFLGTLLLSVIMGIMVRQKQFSFLDVLPFVALSSWLCSLWFHSSDASMWMVMALLLWSTSNIKNNTFLASMLAFNAAVFVTGNTWLARIQLASLLGCAVYQLYQIYRQRVQAL